MPDLPAPRRLRPPRAAFPRTNPPPARRPYIPAHGPNQRSGVRRSPPAPAAWEAAEGHKPLDRLLLALQAAAEELEGIGAALAADEGEQAEKE